MTSLPTPTKSATAQDTSTKKSSPVGTIVGGVVGGVALLTLIGLGILFVKRKTQRRSSSPEGGVSEPGTSTPLVRISDFNSNSAEEKSPLRTSPLPASTRLESPQSATLVGGAPGATHLAYGGPLPVPSSSTGGSDSRHLNVYHVYAKPPETTGVAVPPAAASIPPLAPQHELEPDLFADEPDEVPPEYTEH